MEFNSWLPVLTILIGNGAILGVFTLVFNYYKLKSDRDFEARKTAKDYYMKLYGNIAILDELSRGYQRSIEVGKAKVFTKECKYLDECTYTELSTDEILERFRDAYKEFSSHYIQNKYKGYEIFVSQNLAKLLIKYWAGLNSCFDDTKLMEKEKEVEALHKIAEKITKQMEELFGLK
jgi:hypothetical protein